EVSDTATDEAGNVSAPTTEDYADNTAPDAPGNVVVDSSVPGEVTVSGEAEPGSEVTITFPDGTTETTVADEDGRFEAVVTPAPRSEERRVGEERNAGGNSRHPKKEDEADNTAPDAPSVVVTDNGKG